MKYLQLIWTAMFRSKTRTIFTLLSVLAAFLLFGLLDSVIRVDWLTIPGRAPMRVYYTGGEVWPAELGTFGMPADVRAWRVKNREGCNSMIVPADLGAFLRSRQPPYLGL